MGSLSEEVRTEVLCGHICDLEAENAKLRELAAILCHCMQIKASCDDCHISGHKGEVARDPLAACDGLHEMLRELGVEVPGDVAH